MITRVKLTNWKSHSSTELEFLKGTNVLIGVMGAGKSAVLDAISFGLYGTFPGLNAKKLSLDDCITNKPELKTTARVEIFFEKDGEEYSILREITRGKGTTRSELRKHDQLLEGPQTKRVTEEVVRVLGMNYDLFSRAVYSEQNQIDHFLQIPSGQRKKKIDELLKINRFENSRKTAASLSRRLKTEAQSISSQLSGIKLPDTKKEEEALHEIEKKKAELEKQLEETKKSLAKIEEKTTELEKKQKRIEELKQAIKSAESKMEVYSASQSEIETQLAKAGDYAHELADYRDKLERIKKSGKREAKTNADKALALAQTKRDDTKKKALEREQLLEKQKKLGEKNWQNALIAAIAERESLLARKKELELRAAEARERIQALSKTGEKCPVCDSHITKEKMRELEEDAKQRIQKKEEELAGVIAQLANINIAELESKAKEAEHITQRLKELDEIDVEAAEEAVRKAEKEVENAEKAFAEEERLAEKLRDKIRELEQLEKDKEKLDKILEEKQVLVSKIEKARQELSQQHFDEQELVFARQQVKKLSERLGELDASAKALSELHKEKKKLLAEMKERETEMQALNKRLEVLGKASASMDVFKNAIENTQVQLREQFITGVNDALSMIWRQIYPYNDYPRLRLGVENGDYALQVNTINKDWVNVEGFASGGERSTAALALRIAFSMVLAPHLSWLVLDEPTHNLDSNGVARLSATMRNSLPELVDQIFVITHDEEMEAASTGNLYRLDRDKGKDEPTEVTLVSSGKD